MLGQTIVFEYWPDMDRTTAQSVSSEIPKQFNRIELREHAESPPPATEIAENGAFVLAKTVISDRCLACWLVGQGWPEYLPAQTAEPAPLAWEQAHPEPGLLG